MRIVYVNLEHVLPALDTSRSKFAMWINSPLADMPHILRIETRNETMSVFIEYNRDYESVKSEVMDGYGIYNAVGSPKLTGFDFPAKHFRTAPGRLVKVLEKLASDSNTPQERFNYQCVSKILETHEKELFLPGQ